MAFRVFASALRTFRRGVLLGAADAKCTEGILYLAGRYTSSCTEVEYWEVRFADALGAGSAGRRPPPPSAAFYILLFAISQLRGGASLLLSHSMRSSQVVIAITCAVLSLSGADAMHLTLKSARKCGVDAPDPHCSANYIILLFHSAKDVPHFFRIWNIAPELALPAALPQRSQAWVLGVEVADRPYNIIIVNAGGGRTLGLLRLQVSSIVERLGNDKTAVVAVAFVREYLRTSLYANIHQRTRDWLLPPVYLMVNYGPKTFEICDVDRRVAVIFLNNRAQCNQAISTMLFKMNNKVRSE